MNLSGGELWVDIGYAVLKGIVQGLAEFLPISSTAHLIFCDALAAKLGMRLPSPEEQEFFNILVQMGTLGAVVYYFKRELSLTWTRLVDSMETTAPGWARGFVRPVAILCKGFSNADVNSKTLSDVHLPPEYAEKIDLRHLPRHLFLSVIITVVFTFGVLKGSEFLFNYYNWHPGGAEDISEFFFRYSPFVAIHLLATGCLLFISQKLSDKHSGQGKVVDNKSAALVGLFQGFSAIFHGLSRSGSTISAGLLSGLDRVTATRYSFLLSLPTFILATAYEVLKFSDDTALVDFNWLALLLGTVVSAIVGYFCIKYFLVFLTRNGLIPFAIYCWVVGGSMLVVLMKG
jgi:undecaprenyl-diphosphatase